MKTLLLLTMLSAVSADREAVVRIEHHGRMCSGVHVGDGIVLTAEHCACTKEMEVTFAIGGKKVKFKGVPHYRPVSNNWVDEAFAIQLLKYPEGLPSMKVASNPPKKGDKVITMGWPSGTWAHLEGHITGVSDQRVETNFRTLEGHSGGPLMNMAGEVIGLASTRNPFPKEAREIRRRYPNSIVETTPGAGWVSFSAVQKAMGTVYTQVSPAKLKQAQVIIFTSPGCPPCQALDRDILAGHFSRFNITKVTYNNGAWDRPELYQEWLDTAADRGKKHYFPIIWVRGSKNYQTGYEPARRGGLINTLLNIIDKLVISPLLGEPQSPDFPTLPPPPDEQGADIIPLPLDPNDIPPMPKTESELEKKLNAVLADVDNLKNGNVFEKVGALKSIRGDVAALKDDWKEDLAAHGEATSKQFTNKLDMVLTDVDKLKNGNLFEKAGALKNIRKDVKQLVGEAKTDLKKSIPGKEGFDPLALLGLVGGVIAWWKRKHDDSIVDGGVA